MWTGRLRETFRVFAVTNGGFSFVEESHMLAGPLENSMRTGSIPALTAAILIVFSLFVPSQALSLKTASFEEVRKSADAGVLARVESVASELTDDSGMHGVQTRITLARTAALFGNAPEKIELITAGGQIGKRTVIAPGVPTFSVGENVALFLRNLEGGEFALVGHGMSVFRVRDNTVVPVVACEGGPSASGESWTNFAARFNTASLTLPAAVPESSGAERGWTWKHAVRFVVVALILLLFVLVRRRLRKAAAAVALAIVTAGLSSMTETTYAAPAGSRAFALSGPKWNLSETIRGRVFGGEVLWVRGVGTPDIPDETTFSVITQSFEKWEALPESAIAFRQDGITIESGNGVDERNIVCFQQKVPRKVFDIQTLAITFIVFEDTRMIDTDIVFNDQDVTWAASGGPFSLDVVALHEVGHLLGLDHTSEPSDVMFPTAMGNTTFSAGDIEGAATLYPVAPPQAPVAIIVASPPVGPAPLTVSFSSAGSVSRVTQPLTVSRDFGDGTTSSDAAPSHTYSVPGTYNATLTVTDSAGSATATSTIVAGAAGKTLSVSKFQYKVELVSPLKATKGKDSFSMTLAGADVQAGDKLSLVIGAIRLQSGDGIVLDTRGQFKGELQGGGMISAKLNAKSGELTVGLKSGALGIAFDPRGPNDTSQAGSASFPVALLIQRGDQKIVQTADAGFFFTVKAGNTPGGFLEKSITGKK